MLNIFRPIGMHTDDWPRAVYWCSECDQKEVDSKDATTGHFYSVFGSTATYSPFTLKNDWVQVFFALCKDCED